METRSTTAVLGAGTIGASWTALFAAYGQEVHVYDPDLGAKERVLRLIDSAAPQLAALGAPHAGETGAIRFTTDPVAACEGAQFVQENIPERLELKHALYAQIEPHLAHGAILATSTSGLKLSALMAGLKDPKPLILAHPFNPPHLIPLVELLGHSPDQATILDRAEAFYEGLGKICIRLNHEVTGHIANRLQAAIWREAIHLMRSGVASVGDIDKAVRFGPGLRWSVMGPSMLFHLGGGEGGIRQFAKHLGAPVQSWWDDLGEADLSPETVDALAKGLSQATGSKTMAELAAERDRLILATLLAQKGALD